MAFLVFVKSVLQKGQEKPTIGRLTVYVSLQRNTKPEVDSTYTEPYEYIDRRIFISLRRNMKQYLLSGLNA